MVTKPLELEQINAALMALPKWDTMTDGSQAIVKKVGLFGLALCLQQNALAVGLAWRRWLHRMAYSREEVSR